MSFQVEKNGFIFKIKTTKTLSLSIKINKQVYLMNSVVPAINLLHILIFDILYRTGRRRCIILGHLISINICDIKVFSNFTCCSVKKMNLTNIADQISEYSHVKEKFVKQKSAFNVMDCTVCVSLGEKIA